METTMEKVNTMNYVKYTNKELGDILQGLVAVKDLKGVRFSLQITKNINLIKSELEHIEEAAKPSEEFLEIAKQVQVIEKSGAPEEEMKAAVAKIEEENAELVEARKKQIEEFNSMLEDETELSLFMISESHLPEDITAQQLMGINQLIKE